MEVISENLNLKDLKKNKKVLGIKCVTARNEENRRFKNRYEFDKYQFDSWFINLLKDKNLIDDDKKIDYNQKVNILNIWW